MSTFACPRLPALVLIAAAAIPCRAQETLTYPDLVHRMTDMERLSLLPDAGERAAMWSSWDRASAYDADANRYVKWEANGDGNGRIRMQGDSQVIAEMDGPGVIWRIWSAKPEAGHVRMILDGETASRRQPLP